MRTTLRLVLLFAMLLHLFAAPGHAELNVATYIELTIARLELIDTAWQETDEPPGEEELDELYASYETDREAYFCFSGEMKDEIEAYLEKNTDLRDTIESLSAAIRQRIAEGEE